MVWLRRVKLVQDKFSLAQDLSKHSINSMMNDVNILKMQMHKNDQASSEMIPTHCIVYQFCNKKGIRTQDIHIMTGDDLKKIVVQFLTFLQYDSN